MYEEEVSSENEVDLHLKKKEVVQKLAELSKYEQELEDREQELENLRDELTKKEEHLTEWEMEIKKIAAIVAEEKKRIERMSESLDKLQDEPRTDETPIEAAEAVPGGIENIPEEEAEPLLDEPDEEDTLLPEDLPGDELERYEEDLGDPKKPQKKTRVKKVSKKKKKKSGFFRR
ncbi:MAG: hypothetical protein KAW09_12025 [Thermoplasmata archaeon]|nr:hypothetical protein [Thermoplasmata archaeon]